MVVGDRRLVEGGKLAEGLAWDNQRAADKQLAADTQLVAEDKRLAAAGILAVGEDRRVAEVDNWVEDIQLAAGEGRQRPWAQQQEEEQSGPPFSRRDFSHCSRVSISSHQSACASTILSRVGG